MLYVANLNHKANSNRCTMDTMVMAKNPTILNLAHLLTSICNQQKYI